MQIVVLGAHRSGTSLITRIISMMGAYWGPESESIGEGEENPKGFWERADVIHANDTLLQAAGATWDNSALWDKKVVTRQALENFSHEAKTIIADMDAHAPWVMKDPRMCLTFSCWKPLLRNPLCVFVYRNPLEIARSLQKRNGFPIHHSLALWEHYMVLALEAARELPTLFIDYEKFLANPIAESTTLCEWLVAVGKEKITLPTDDEILSFTDPSLRRSVIEGVELSEVLNAQQLELVEYCKGKALPDKLELSISSKMILADNVTHSINMLYNLQEDLHLSVRKSIPDMCEIKERIAAMHEEIHQSGISIIELDKQNHHLRNNIHAIQQSKRWKLGNGIAAIVSRVGGRLIAKAILRKVAPDL